MRSPTVCEAVGASEGEATCRSLPPVPEWSSDPPAPPASATRFELADQRINALPSQCRTWLGVLRRDPLGARIGVCEPEHSVYYALQDGLGFLGILLGIKDLVFNSSEKRRQFTRVTIETEALFIHMDIP